MDSRTSKWRLNIKSLQRARRVDGVRIQRTCDVDLARQSHVGLAHGTQQRAVVHQPSDAIIHDQFLEKFVVQHVSVDKGA